MSEMFTVQTRDATCQSVVKADSSKDAAESWAEDWLDECDENECDVFLHGVLIARFDVKREIVATAKEITT